MKRNNTDQIKNYTPQALRELPQWVCWRLQKRKDKLTKIPYSAHTGKLASSTNPSDWCSFDDALDAFENDNRYMGIGFVFSKNDNFCGIDLDDCIDSDTVLPWAQEIIDSFNSYTEISPSGHGVKTFIQGNKPGTKCRKPYESGEIEIYDHARFFTVTGNRLDGTPLIVANRKTELDELYDKLFTEDSAPKSAKQNKVNIDTIIPPTDQDENTSNEIPCLTDDEIIRLVTETGPNKDKFSALWAGRWNDYYNSPSNADSSVVFKLAFYTKDTEQIDRIFRQSGLFRNKWDEIRGEQTYGQLTIAKALETVTDQYRPRKRFRRSPILTTEQMDELLECGDVGKVFDQAEAIASLDKAEFGKFKARLKDVYGSDLNLRDFTSAVSEARIRLRQEESRNNSGLPSIMTSGKQLREMVQEGVHALQLSNDPPKLFTRSGTIATLQESDTSISIRSLCGSDTPTMKDHLSRSADFFKTTSEGESIPCTPPYDMASVILARSDLPFPILDGVTRSPVIRTDGTILLDSGYDPRSQLYYRPDSDLQLPLIPDQPSTEQITAAVNLLREMICDFPFTEEAGKVNFFALLLAIVMRPLIDGCVPLALIDAPRQGTGKGLLASLVGMVTNGGDTAIMTTPKAGNEDEWRKRITSTLMGGPSVVLLDNIVEPLDSASLAAMLTAREWEDRRLGVSENVRLPVRSVWFGTGNNIQVQGDMPRRCYHIRIDSNLSQPWLRNGFRHPNLREWVMERRGKLLAALLIIARAWCVAGRPSWSGSPLGSFEAWSRNVGGALEYAGLPGFLTNTDRLYKEADEDTQEWSAFFAAWANTFGSSPVKVKDICEEILRSNYSGYPTMLRETLPSDLVTAIDKGAGNLSRRLGYALRSRRDTVFGNNRVMYAGVDSHDKIALWKLACLRTENTRCPEKDENITDFAGDAGNNSLSPAALPADLNPFKIRSKPMFAGDAGNR